MYNSEWGKRKRICQEREGKIFEVKNILKKNEKKEKSEIQENRSRAMNANYIDINVRLKPVLL